MPYRYSRGGRCISAPIPDHFNFISKREIICKWMGDRFRHKKRRHERSVCSCREASDATYFRGESGK
jgi:hypothetical protein